MSLVIRRAEPSDGEKVQRFVFEITRSYGLEPDPEGIDSDVMNYGEANDCSVQQWVAEVSKVVVGSIALIGGENNVAHLATFFVDLRFQGQGIGRALLEHAVTVAQSEGYVQVELETRKNYKKAIHLYESMGWVRVYSLPNSNGMDMTYSLSL
ncbi:GNAT family N-acetyltransferase [Romeria aff. gracilis LEGE 07310]|uniref:GNAT family N-acetyltransferase n=1 Tax=Vasconcelosia minhoensis LEGE 07310 TaxID=915328 RepID=A0A8J7ALX7_9CYAN|nr:GNAT family N-acetyltransferase [Romeria gracilis]MBE9080383.1 GNAT family N-acetyltransferase [Romeria aff. gracilis LEGE 07310]